MSAVTMPVNSFNMNGIDDGMPQILNELSGGGEVLEGEPVHLELNLASVGDLQVQWYKNGVPLNAGSRYNTVCDRGLAYLDIVYTIFEDSASYFCTISNACGTVQTQEVVVNVIPEIDSNEDQVGVDYADVYQASTGPLKEYERDQMNQPASLPTFVNNPVISKSEVIEGEPVIIEAHLSTTRDSTLSVDWMKNNQLVGSGSRFNAIVDRGLVVLQIGYSLVDDSGEYVCVATNAFGRVESQPVMLTCIPEDRIVTTSILDESSINHLKELENPGEENDIDQRESVQNDPPTFKSSVEPPMIQLIEDESVVFCVPVDCGNGHRVKMEWFKGDELVITGSRITGSLEMGIASLKILYAQPLDSGTYTCQISTEYGVAKSDSANLLCEGSDGIIAASQIPGDKSKGLMAIEAIEANLHAPKQFLWEEDGPFEMPVIVQQPQEIGEIEEATAVHIDVQVAPIEDPSLVIEWYKDGKNVISGTRFKVSYERGYASLDLVYTISEDSGEYWCHIMNKAGQVESNRIHILCHPSESVITHSNLLEGSEGYNLIKAIEQIENPTNGDYNYVDEEVTESVPNFDIKPQATVIGEGEPVKFLVRVSGKPTPNLTWFLNDELIQQDSMTKIFNDGAINYLEMSRCPTLKGSNILRVVADNKLGTAEAETVLTVVLAEDFRPDLKHVKIANPYKKMLELRKVDCTPELNKAFMRSKQSAQTIMAMERGTEMKARMFRSPEVLEAEKMLDKLALNLRKSESKRISVDGYTE